MAGWVIWIILTIGSFFLAAAFWTPVIARYYGTIRETKTAVLWISAVFGSWMAMLLPLIVIMYQKVDKAYEDARLRREKAAMKFRSIWVEKSKRLLPDAVSAKIDPWPETIEGGRLVTVILKDGRKIPHVFIAGSREILGIYDFTDLPFEGGDVVDAEPANLENLPQFFAAHWLRLDGVGLPE